MLFCSVRAAIRARLSRSTSPLSVPPKIPMRCTARAQVIRSLFEMAVGEVEILFPVVSRHGVLARADAVADEIADGMADRRPVAHAEAGLAVQLIDRLRAFRAEKFAARIRP